MSERLEIGTRYSVDFVHYNLIALRYLPAKLTGVLTGIDEEDHILYWDSDEWIGHDGEDFAMSVGHLQRAVPA